MTDAEVLLQAETYLDALREILKVDPVYRLTVRGGCVQVSRCEKDLNSALSWILHLDTKSHQQSSDVKYSVIEFIMNIHMSDLDFIQSPLVGELRARVATRLTLAIDGLLPDLDEGEELE
jgi:hypothetical protein